MQLTLNLFGKFEGAKLHRVAVDIDRGGSGQGGLGPRSLAYSLSRMMTPERTIHESL